MSARAARRQQDPARRRRSSADLAQARRLRVTRIVLGLSEAQAADAFGVRVETYRGYEAGARMRSSWGIISFARLYKVSLDWILEGDGALLKPHLSKEATGKVAILPVRLARS